MRESRKILRLTQEQVAENLCDRSYISLLESDKVSPPIDLLMKIAERLEVPLDYLLQGKNWSMRSRGQLAYVDDLIEAGKFGRAIEHLEQLWWDTIHYGDYDRPDAVEIAHRVQKIVASPTSTIDESWLTTMAVWLLGQEESQTAYQLAYTIQQSLFARGEWLPSMRWGRTLLGLVTDDLLRSRIIIATGSALLRSGNFKQAEQQYTDFRIMVRGGHERNPAFAWVKHGLSAVHANLGMWDEAYQAAMEATRMYSQLKSPLYWLSLQNVGIALRALGKQALSQEALIQCKLYWKSVQNAPRLRELEVELHVESD